MRETEVGTDCQTTRDRQIERERQIERQKGRQTDEEMNRTDGKMTRPFEQMGKQT